MTGREVAEHLAVSLATVERLVRAGELTKVRVGGSIRFEACDVDALVERGKQHDDLHGERAVPSERDR